MPDRLESGAKVCPYCSYGLSADGVCTSCGKRLDPGDWPVEAAYLPDGLQAIAEGNAVRYALPVGQEALHAQLSANPHLPHDIPYQDPLWVGDTLQDAIRLERSGAVRAVFYRNRRSHECWVLDQSRFASVRVNGKFVRNAKLVANDVIDIAGVRLSFDGGSIGRHEDVSEGVTLSAHGAGVAVGGRDILRNVSFSIPPGEFVGVLGPSGCGKSTLLQRIVGLTAPEHCSGKIAFNGIDGADLPDGAIGICAYLPQNAEEMLHPGLSLREEMTCYIAIHGGCKDDESQIEPLLDLLGLSGELDSPVSKLSGGQKRRAAIAMTLLRRPRIVLLDEPTAGLDPASDAEVMVYLRKIAENKHVTILCATHVLGNMNCFTRVLALTGSKENSPDLNGRLVFCGPPDRLVKSVCPHLATDPDDGQDMLAAASRRLSDVYATLLAGAPGLDSIPDCDSNATPNGVEDVEYGPPPAGSSFKGYLRRMWTAFRSGGRFIRSVPAFLFVWMPLGVVACIRIGCTDDFSSPATGAIYFCCIIALFLLGLCHSATRLVDGRVPGRCLERLAGVSTSAYLAAKIVGSLGLCAVQTLSFCAFWQIAIKLPASWFSPSAGESLALVGPLSTFWTIPVLFIASFMGSLVGLSVSAIVRNRATAVNCVPVVAVIVLFFSQPNVGYLLSDVANVRRSGAPALAERISYVTPTVYPQRFLAAAYQVAAAREAVYRAKPARVAAARRHLANMMDDFLSVALRLLGLLGLYLASAFLVLWFYEPAREREWNGR